METNGFIIVQRIDRILKQRNENRNVMCKALNFKPAVVSAWSTRGSIPHADIAVSIAKYLGVSTEWLITGEDSSLTEEEMLVLQDFRAIAINERAFIRQQIHDAAVRGKATYYINDVTDLFCAEDK